MDKLGDRLRARSSDGIQQPQEQIGALPIVAQESSRTLSAATKEKDDLHSRVSYDPHLRTESELFHLRCEHEDLGQRYHEALNKIQNWETWALEREKELTSLRQQNALLGQELQACKDDLFKINPISRTPDSDISHAYENLGEQISSWMDNEISYFETDFRRTHSKSLPDLFHDGGVPEVKRFLTIYSQQLGEYLIRHVMQLQLHKTIFAKGNLLPGLGKNETAFLKEVKDTMSRIKPPRGILNSIHDFKDAYLQDTDPEMINNWRSETLIAVSETEWFARNCQHAYFDITETIFDEVSNFFPILKKTSQSVERLLKSVVYPAIKLAHMMKLSPTSYELVPKISAKDSFRSLWITPDHLKNSKAIDLATGKTLKIDSSVEVNEQGRVGFRLMVLAPALYRKNPDNSKLLLVKEMMLVKLLKPLGKRREVTGRQESE
ncbi:MAG: hypothetical protein Q9220_000582 [cf. Caloplaca sp. 1 TL-2023]